MKRTIFVIITLLLVLNLCKMGSDSITFAANDVPGPGTGVVIQTTLNS